MSNTKAKEVQKGVKKGTKKAAGKRLFITAYIITTSVILIGLYATLAVFFHTHYWLNTKINGVDYSGKSVEVVKELITDQVNIYRLHILERDGKKESISGSSIALQPEFDGELEQVKDNQKGFAWIISLFHQTDVNSPTIVNYEEEKFASAWGALNCVQEANVVIPENAHISAFSPDQGFEIVPEIMGSQLDLDQFTEVLKTAINGLSGEVSLESNNCYVDPAIYAEDEGLASLLADMNRCAMTTLTYNIAGDTEDLDRTMIASWLIPGEDNHAAVDTAQVAAYVSALAQRHNTVYRPKILQSSWGGEVTVPGGNYGWAINQEEEVAQLAADIQSGDPVTREPIWKQKAAGYGTTDYGNTYVEVNVAAQHLFYYKDGALVVDTDFVSGLPGGERETQTGAYRVAYRQRDTVLRGRDYASHVSFWMPFHNGQGLHDATWRNKFGGVIYQTQGSHGCVNMPYGAAKILFENIEAGTPVLVY